MRRIIRRLVVPVAVALPLAAHAKSTKIDYPKPFFHVNVAADGTVTGGGGNIVVTHRDGAWNCVKIAEVGVHYKGTRSGFIGGSMTQLRRALCNFDNVVPVFVGDPARQVSVTLPFDAAPSASDIPAVKSHYVKECQKLASTTRQNGGETTTHHPYYSTAEVLLSAQTGTTLATLNLLNHAQFERHPNLDLPIHLACASCPDMRCTHPVVDLVADQMTNVQVATLVSAVPLAVERAEIVGLPTGMFMQGATASGRPVAGTYHSKIRAWSTCKSGINYAEFPITINVKPALAR